MTPKVQRIIGWVLSGLLGAFLIVGSATGKFFDFPGKAELFEKLGWSVETIVVIGVIEILATLIFLVPRTGFLGAVLLTGYLGGAIAAHVRIGEPPIFQIVFAVLVWVALALRQPVIWRLAVGANLTPPPPPAA